MAKIMMLVPKSYMVDYAEIVIKENRFDIKKVIQTETADVVEEAQKCIDEGANVIIARGVQAQLIKNHTNIPVAEITMTAQEIGLLVVECKKIIKKETPKIALISLNNMINNVSHFNDLFDVNLNTYLTATLDQLEYAVEQAVNDEVDIILGGDHVIKCVEKYNIPALFLGSTQDSLLESIKLANKMGYAIDIEKSNAAQLETMLDTSFSGIIKIDRNHNVMIVNHIVEELLEKQASQLIGKQLEDEIKDIDYHSIESILNGKIDNYSTTVNIKGNTLFFMVGPIQYDDEITGAILSYSGVKSSIILEQKKSQDIYHKGYIAHHDFSYIKSEEPKMKECIELGKKYAISNYPVLIYGEVGTEREILAECIHNNSARKSFPFVSINCSKMNDIDQYNYLFGNSHATNEKDKTNGIIQDCNFGTVYISDVESLNPISQYQLYKVIHSKGSTVENLRNNKKTDVRIITGTNRELAPLVKNELFRKDLYYSINALTLNVPPLRDRKQDIEGIVRNYLKQFTKEYTTHLTINEEAMKEIREYTWEGNMIQLKSFCERLFVTTYKKNIDQGMVIGLLEELYPYVKEIDGEERIVIYKDPEAKEIVEALKKYDGNRKAVAQELDISTTTLWRRMNKYGISNNFIF